ncbi:unnamed protein product [Lota lota]
MDANALLPSAAEPRGPRLSVNSRSTAAIEAGERGSGVKMGFKVEQRLSGQTAPKAEETGRLARAVDPPAKPVGSRPRRRSQGRKGCIGPGGLISPWGGICDQRRRAAF